MMALGDAAKRLGLPVFACGPDKRPIVETGFKAASTEPAVIGAMFARPNAQLIGVPTGDVSGLVVIDIDIREDRTGMDWLNANSEALPQTRTHKTRSGGLHLVFLYPEGHDIRNSASRVAPGVDVRGRGGYIIVPPSPGYQVADPTEPAEMPLWLIRACTRPEAPPQPPPGPKAAPRHDGGSSYGLAALEGECDAIRTAPFGQQEATLNAAALKIGALVAAGEIEEGIAVGDLLSAGRSMASQGGREPWTPTEIEAKVRRAFADGMNRPRAAPARPAPNGHDHTADEAYWASLEADLAMTPEQWHDLEALESGQTVPASPQTKAAAGSSLLWSIVDPWDEAAIPTRPWIARGYLMRGAVTVVSGPGSAGKSSLMVAWAVALALGCAFSRFKVPGPLKVATYNVEDDANEQKRRFSAMCAHLNLKPDAFEGRLAILGPEKVGTLLHMPRDGRPMLNTPVMDRIVSFLDEFEPDVLMLDPFVELHGAEENDNTAVRAVMAAFRAIAAERKIAIVILHHARKGAGTPGDPDSLRGASSIVGAARVALTLNVMTEDEAKAFNIRPDDRRDYFRLDGAKSNYAPIGEAEWFKRQERFLANGDGVAVAWPWTPPNLLKQAPIAELQRVLEAIETGFEDGVPFAPTRRGNGNKRWVGNVIASMLQGSEEQAKEIVAKWLRTGLLYEISFADPRTREPAKGVKVDFSKRPDGSSDAGNTP